MNELQRVYMVKKGGVGGIRINLKHIHIVITRNDMNVYA